MKFKLSKNDSKSLSNSQSMIENPVLSKAALEVNQVQVSGGKVPDFVKVEYLQVIWAQA